MQFAVTIFATAESMSPGEIAKAVEDSGFEAIMFPDHTHIPANRESPWPGGGEMPEHYRRIYDAMIALAFAAQATKTLKLGVGVCLVPERDPIVLAKQIASLDVLSGGRILFGVGAGWNAEEAANHGIDPKKRWAIMRERVLAMKKIWTEDEAEFHGEHVNFDRIWSWPKPLQKPHPPIIVGGHGPNVMKRIVEYGDEWIPMASPGLAPLNERIAQLQAMAAAAGRPRIKVSPQAYGTPPKESVIERYIEAGADRIVLGLPSGPAEVVLPALKLQAELVKRYA